MPDAAVRGTGRVIERIGRAVIVLTFVCLPSQADDYRSPLEPANRQLEEPGLATGERIAHYLERKRVEYNIPGLSWAVVRDGAVVAAGGLGMASPEFSVEADENTVYPISSTSKMSFMPFTPMCPMRSPSKWTR